MSSILVKSEIIGRPQYLDLSSQVILKAVARSLTSKNYVEPLLTFMYYDNESYFLVFV